MKIKINVTQDHINRSLELLKLPDRYICRDCPVSLAVREKIHDSLITAYGQIFVKSASFTEISDYLYEIDKWQAVFDANYHVSSNFKPFSATINFDVKKFKELMPKEYNEWRNKAKV